MEMSGEHRIAAPRQQVWDALNDPEILKQCIPGCQEIEKTGENEMAAKVKAKVGPVNATFSGKVSLSNLNPPESYTISGEGTGGAAGFAKGGADVTLEDQGDATDLKYKVNAQVGGKLAQLGQRLIQSTANKYAKQFFENFSQIVGGGAESAEGKTAEAAGEQPSADAQQPSAAAAQTAETASQPAADSGEAVEAGVRAASLGHAAPEGPTGRAGEEARERAEQQQASAATGAGAEAPRGPEPAQSGGLRPKVWIGGLVVLVILLLLIFAL